MVHGIAVILLLTLSLNNSTASVMLHRSALVLLFGSGIFSFSLYLLVLSDIKILGAITPLGGLLMLIGWGIAIFGI